MKESPGRGAKDKAWSALALWCLVGSAVHLGHEAMDDAVVRSKRTFLEGL